MRYTNRKVTEDPVVERLLDLLKEQGKTEKSLLQYLGLANGTFTLWKYDNGKSFLIGNKTAAEKKSLSEKIAVAYAKVFSPSFEMNARYLHRYCTLHASSTTVLAAQISRRGLRKFLRRRQVRRMRWQR